MSDIADALREDDEIGFGTVTLESPGGGSAELVGWVTTGCFEDTEEPAAVVVTTDDDTRDGEPERQRIFPLTRVLQIAWEWDELSAGGAGL